MNSSKSFFLFSIALMGLFSVSNAASNRTKPYKPVPVASYATLTLVLLACRVAHGVCYIANQDILRSLAFLGSFGICIYMFVLAL